MVKLISPEIILVVCVGVFLMLVYMTKAYLKMQKFLLKTNFSFKKKTLCYSFALAYIIFLVIVGVLVIYLGKILFKETFLHYGVNEAWMVLPLALGVLYGVLYCSGDFVWVNENISRALNTPPHDVLSEEDEKSLR